MPSEIGKQKFNCTFLLVDLTRVNKSANIFSQKMCVLIFFSIQIWCHPDHQWTNGERVATLLYRYVH